MMCSTEKKKKTLSVVMLDDEEEKEQAEVIQGKRSLPTAYISACTKRSSAKRRKTRNAGKQLPTNRQILERLGYHVEGRARFPHILHKMVSSETEGSGIVEWNESDGGKSFVIKQPLRFEEEVLPSWGWRLSSWERQMNFYEFSKMGINAERPSSRRLRRGEPSKWYHPKFHRSSSRRDLCQINRKTNPDKEKKTLSLEVERNDAKLLNIEKRLLQERLIADILAEVLQYAQGQSQKVYAPIEKYSDDVVSDASKLAASIESMLEISKKRSPVLANISAARQNASSVGASSSASASTSACASKALKIQVPVHDTPGNSLSDICISPSLMPREVETWRSDSDNDYLSLTENFDDIHNLIDLEMNAMDQEDIAEVLPRAMQHLQDDFSSEMLQNIFTPRLTELGLF
eukprot:g4976.t1